ncbi:hypothetical protein DL96DRAFT_1685253 [Flagelloscypha sp. PMI_526]|nr:hypothetical protein DL96DRAFT_1685253 [Flagelloscypha sp. PMI_526]
MVFVSYARQPSDICYHQLDAGNLAAVPVPAVAIHVFVSLGRCFVPKTRKGHSLIVYNYSTIVFHLNSLGTINVPQEHSHARPRHKNASTGQSAQPTSTTQRRSGDQKSPSGFGPLRVTHIDSSAIRSSCRRLDAVLSSFCAQIDNQQLLYKLHEKIGYEGILWFLSYRDLYSFNRRVDGVILWTHPNPNPRITPSPTEVKRCSLNGWGDSAGPKRPSLEHHFRPLSASLGEREPLGFGHFLPSFSRTYFACRHITFFWRENGQDPNLGRW